jgi:hypothetical protein
MCQHVGILGYASIVMWPNVRREYVNLCNGCFVAFEGYMSGMKGVVDIFDMEFVCGRCERS